MSKNSLVLVLSARFLTDSAFAGTMGTITPQPHWSWLQRAQGQTMNTGLRLNHLYTKGLLLNLTYTA